MEQKKEGLAGMKIKKFSVVLDGDGRNILEEDFSRDYNGSDSLDTPAKIVAVMEVLFCDHIIISRENYFSFRENGKIGDRQKKAELPAR